MTKTTALPRKHDSLRRRLTAAAVLGPLLAPFWSRAAATASVEVWTGPSCGCCHDWIKHLQTNGFEVITHDGSNSEARTRLGMPIRYGSCHSGTVNGYAIEGHVPAREIHRLLEERPDAIGLSVPAMPRGSPGMDGPVYGNVHDPYDVLLIRRDGSADVYEPYRSATTSEPANTGTKHAAEGTVSAVDPAAGTVTIAHGAVATANWPAMTMPFKFAGSAAAEDLRTGDRVRFKFTIEGGMSATVTDIARSD